MSLLSSPALARAALWSLLPSAYDQLAELCGGSGPPGGVPVSSAALRGQTWAEMCQDWADEDLGAEFDARSGILLQPVRGTIYRGADAELEAFYGCYNSERIEQAAAYAMEDAQVRALVLAIDSPGGYTAGMEATLASLAALRAARPDLPVLACVTGQCCSMAYIFAAGCGAIHCLTGAEIGGIGVYAITSDSSQLYKNAGIERRLVADGKYKGMGAAGIPWTEDWHAAVRASVDATSAAIRAHVSAARPGLTVDDMQGQYWEASAAPAALHDGIPASALADYLSLLAAEL